MRETSEIGQATRAGRREWIGLAVLALACLLYSMDLTVLHLAVPALSADLRPSGTQLLWIIDIYGFMVAGSLLTMGTLGDRIGRRRLLLIGAASFGAMSLLAAFSVSAEMLIVSRALMGIAGATLAPGTLSLIFTMFRNQAQRAVAIGVWITAFSAGGAIGPVAGGLLLERFWWGSVFLLALPVMALLLVLGPRVLPEYRDPEAGELDIASAVMSLVAILAVIYGLKETAQRGFDPVAILSIVFGVGMGIRFVLRQAQLESPLIDMSLFRIRRLNAALVTNLLGIFIAFGYFLFVAQYLQLVLGLTPLEAGLWSLPSAAGFIIGSNVSPHFVHRFRPSLVLGTSLAAASGGLLVLTQVGTEQGIGLVVVGSVLISLALSPVFTLTTELVVGSAPPEKAGAASGISETGAELGGALGIAILGSIGAVVYRSGLDTLPADLAGPAARAVRETLGAAVAVSQDLPEALGTVVLETARQAFVRGMHVTAAVSAAIALGSGILAAVLLRGVPARGSEGEDRPGASP